MLSSHCLLWPPILEELWVVNRAWETSGETSLWDIFGSWKCWWVAFSSQGRNYNVDVSLRLRTPKYMRYRTPNLKKPEQILVPLFRLPSHKLFYKQSFVKTSSQEEKWKISNITFWGPHNSIISIVHNITIKHEMRRNNFTYWLTKRKITQAKAGEVGAWELSPSQGGGACSQDPLTFLDFIPCSPLLKPLVPKNDFSSCSLDPQNYCAVPLIPRNFYPCSPYLFTCFTFLFIVSNQ